MVFTIILPKGAEHYNFDLIMDYYYTTPKTRKCVMVQTNIYKYRILLLHIHTQNRYSTSRKDWLALDQNSNNIAAVWAGR